MSQQCPSNVPVMFQQCQQCPTVLRDMYPVLRNKCPILRNKCPVLRNRFPVLHNTCLVLLNNSPSSAHTYYLIPEYLKHVTHNGMLLCYGIKTNATQSWMLPVSEINETYNIELVIDHYQNNQNYKVNMIIVQYINYNSCWYKNKTRCEMVMKSLFKGNHNS